MSKRQPPKDDLPRMMAEGGLSPAPRQTNQQHQRRRKAAYFNNETQLDLVEAAAAAQGEMIGQFIRTAAMNRVCEVLDIKTGEAAVAFLRLTGGQFSDSGLMELFDKLPAKVSHRRPNCREACLIELARMNGNPVTVFGLHYAVTRGGVKCSLPSVRRVLGDMVHEGIVERVAGPGRAVKYRLIGGNGDE